MDSLLAAAGVDDDDAAHLPCACRCRHEPTLLPNRRRLVELSRLVILWNRSSSSLSAATINSSSSCDDVKTSRYIGGVKKSSGRSLPLPVRLIVDETRNSSRACVELGDVFHAVRSTSRRGLWEAKSSRVRSTDSDSPPAFAWCCVYLTPQRVDDP